MDDWETRQKIDKDEKDDEGNIIEKMKSTTNKMDIDIELNIIEGDVNDDGVINTKDIELIQNYINKNIEFNEKQKSRADIDGNGLINIDDVSKLQKNIADVNEFVEETQEDGTVTLTQKLAIYQINNIDFGIIERPKQSLEINKRVKQIKIVLANGQTIVDAKIKQNPDKTYSLEDNIKYVTYMGPGDKTNPKNGFARIEIDNELIQGATVYITYEISVDNISEIDYNNSEYYLYGNIKNESDIIKIKPTGIYDYLDDKVKLSDGQADWEVVKNIKDIYKNESNKIIEPTILEKYIKDYYKVENLSDGSLKEIYGYELFESQSSGDSSSWTIDAIRTKRLKNKTVLNNTSLNALLEKGIIPGDKKSVELKAQKVLSNSDVIELNNDSEIIDIEHIPDQGGRIVKDVKTLYDRGETITITPPTGSTNKTLEIIIISISSLIILATGIIFIRKKVL